MTIPATATPPRHAHGVPPSALCLATRPAVDPAALTARLACATTRVSTGAVSLAAYGLYTTALLDLGTNPRTWRAAASAARLGAAAGRTDKQVRQQLAELVDAGLLIRALQVPVRGPNGGTVYRTRYFLPDVRGLVA